MQVLPLPRELAPVLWRPRRSLRARLTLLYAGLCFASGLALLAIANVPLLAGTSVRHTVPAPGQVPGGGAQASSAGPGPHLIALFAAIALITTAVLSLVFGWLIAGRVLRPLRMITATARRISASSLHERLNIEGPQEFRELGETLDELFGRLEASFESQRHFVANASHELRTPLTAERTLLQVALADPDASAATLRATCEQLVELSNQQERLIAALLTLASSERGIGQREPFDLADIAGKAVAARHADAERRGIRVDAALAVAPAAGDPRLAESLVANLLDNALRHNVAGGRVEISTARTAGRAVISVGNTGILIPSDKLGRLFEPFQQLGGERIRHTDGHGLGLAIVRAIASAHSAALSARPRPDGGLDVEVGFP
jgi:signal transduction histidine kinase